ncbi:WecB/TagA/CpsF family glycosyltransferase [Paenibacillus aquistagni]|uniref:WecB/TagA/CpsF family glycosyltransferase n=1 Tax=Paenibacillus aquistagni TaxID=1852522 RepID=UPI000B505980|nr:WecB/TagA/CpsF family glycosyltransferase [Paenibacillus aquistagni]
MQETVSILGIPFSKCTMQETVDRLSNHIEDQQASLLHLITVNPEIAIRCQRDKEVQQIVKEADWVTPDGVGILYASKRLGNPIAERVTGYELLLKLLASGNQQQWGFYFLGADEESNAQAVAHVQQHFPRIRIAGRHHGFFAPEEETAILSDIQSSKPNILIVAMGAPYSDKWISRHKEALADVKLVFGVGGSLDVLSGKVKETPKVWKQLNLEWLYRLLTVPPAKGQASRWRRQTALPVFVYRAIIRKPT